MDQTQVQASSGPPGAVRALAGDPSSRKRFLRMMGGGAAATSALGIFLAACGEEEESTTAPEVVEPEAGADLEIVQYALLLELLEQDFYDQVLESGEIKDKELDTVIKLVYQNEREHVDVLTSVAEQFGAAPVEPPATKFKPVLAGGERRILETSAMIENLGASAYLGQANRIQSGELLAAALSIHTVEARHAARLNELAGNGFTTGGDLKGSIPDGAFAKPMDMDEVLKLTEPFIAS